MVYRDGPGSDREEVLEDSCLSFPNRVSPSLREDKARLSHWGGHEKTGLRGSGILCNDRSIPPLRTLYPGPYPQTSEVKEGQLEHQPHGDSVPERPGTSAAACFPSTGSQQ